ncbi:MAG: glycosyltransferase family 25 protein [Nitrospiraceae bacterium]|nr:glycosyltransferase family 25 protein [Nitrospiraceae bacterium]
MISDHFEKIFIINMLRSFKRRASSLFQIGKMNIKNAHLIEAVDGMSIDIRKMKAEGSLKWNDWEQRELTQGEVGCYLSHQKIWELIVQQNLKKVLICEDDIIWRTDANETSDWDIIHFHSNISVGSGQHNDIHRRKISEHVWRGCNEGGGAVCYAISFRGAGFLLQKAFPIRYAVDGILNKLTSPKRSSEYHGYVCWPFLCGLSNSPSEIDIINPRRDKNYNS